MTGESVDILSLKQLPILYRVGVVGNLTDGQLLDRFLGGPGEAAQASFAALVDRHATMVFRVCRQVLNNPHDAEDAFQATFLVLARKAASLRKRDSLASWLHGIALRVARKSVARKVRRELHERRRAAMVEETWVDPERDPERWTELHHEIDRLPQKYRQAIVLCYLEGLSTEAAAGRLGCPQGTILSRLARARAQLGHRLRRKYGVIAVGSPALLPSPVAAPADIPPELLKRVVHAAADVGLHSSSLAKTVSTPVATLTQEVIRAMVFTKLRAAAVAVVAIAAVGAGAGALFRPAPDYGPAAIQRARESRPAPSDPRDRRKSPPLADTSVVPRDLEWTEVPPGEWLEVLDELAAKSKANFDKIKTWKGSCRLSFRQYLGKDFVAGLPVPQGKAEPLMQEVELTQSFCLDVATGNIYRDLEGRSMKFFRVGTNEPVVIPNVGPSQGRSILTAGRYLEFRPNEKVTTAFLPDHPDAKHKCKADCFDAREARRRQSQENPDPRDFFMLDPGNHPWSGAELYARALRGLLGEEQFKEVARRFTMNRAEGPGGRWYWEQSRLDGSNGTKDLYLTLIWSPQAGCNPVVRLLSWDQPDGKLEASTEWQWKVVDGIAVPSSNRSVAYHSPDGGPSLERKAELVDCVLNQPLDPHQFDEQGLGLKDGDVVVNHIDRVVYMLKDGKPVKLGNFVR